MLIEIVTCSGSQNGRAFEGSKPKRVEMQVKEGLKIQDGGLPDRPIPGSGDPNKKRLIRAAVDAVHALYEVRRTEEHLPKSLLDLSVTDPYLIKKDQGTEILSYLPFVSV